MNIAGVGSPVVHVHVSRCDATSVGVSVIVTVVPTDPALPSPTATMMPFAVTCVPARSMPVSGENVSPCPELVSVWFACANSATLTLAELAAVTSSVTLLRIV